MQSIAEIWKDIQGYEGLYQVSNLGRVKSLGRFIESRLKGVDKVWKAERILKTCKRTNGYIGVGLRKNGKGKNFNIHRLVAIAFLDNPENKPQVNHIDGNKKNNNVSNLEWVTNSENQKHAYKHGLIKTIPTEDRYNYDKEHHMSKKVRQLDMNGNVIAEYFSFAQAARAVGLKSYTNISNAAKNDKLTAKGYKWELVE